MNIVWRMAFLARCTSNYQDEGYHLDWDLANCHDNQSMCQVCRLVSCLVLQMTAQCLMLHFHGKTVTDWLSWVWNHLWDAVYHAAWGLWCENSKCSQVLFSNIAALWCWWSLIKAGSSTRRKSSRHTGTQLWERLVLDGVLCSSSPFSV